MEESQRPSFWDVASPEEAAKWARLVERFQSAAEACMREVKREEELAATRREIEALPTTPSAEEQ